MSYLESAKEFLTGASAPKNTDDRLIQLLTIAAAVFSLGEIHSMLQGLDDDPARLWKRPLLIHLLEMKTGRELLSPSR